MKNTIVCPKCGMEYAPSEIYLPNAFIGKANHVFREADGTISDIIGEERDLKESYICDGCNTKFYVKATVKFMTSINEDEDFSQEYKSQLQKVKLFLDEE